MKKVIFLLITFFCFCLGIQAQIEEGDIIIKGPDYVLQGGNSYDFKIESPFEIKTQTWSINTTSDFLTLKEIYSINIPIPSAQPKGARITTTTQSNFGEFIITVSGRVNRYGSDRFYTVTKKIVLERFPVSPILEGPSIVVKGETAKFSVILKEGTVYNNKFYLNDELYSNYNIINPPSKSYIEFNNLPVGKYTLKSSLHAQWGGSLSGGEQFYTLIKDFEVIRSLEEMSITVVDRRLIGGFIGSNDIIWYLSINNIPGPDFGPNNVEFIKVVDGENGIFKSSLLGSISKSGDTYSCIATVSIRKSQSTDRDMLLLKINYKGYKRDILIPLTLNSLKNSTLISEDLEERQTVLPYSVDVVSISSGKTVHTIKNAHNFDINQTNLLNGAYLIIKTDTNGNRTIDKVLKK